MEDGILNNIWNYLTSQGQVQVSFEEWKNNVSNSPEIQIKIHEYLTKKGKLTNTLEEWQIKTGLKKKRRRRNHYGLRYRNWFFGLSRVRVSASKRNS